jgi:hypothetical protein
VNRKERTEVLDLIYLAEAIWCIVWFRGKGMRQVVLYAGGIVSSGYVATQLSDWLAKTFAAPSSTVFVWIESHISTDSETVSALARFVPPEPTWTGLSQTQWIALNVIKGILFVSMTLAIFVLFLTISYLVDALWDRRHLFDAEATGPLSSLVGFGCGLYIIVLTNLLLVDLAWLKGVPGIGHVLNDSVLFHVTAKLHEVKFR